MSLTGPAARRRAVVWIVHHRILLPVACLLCALPLAYDTYAPTRLPWQIGAVFALSSTVFQLSWFGATIASLRHLGLVCSWCLDRVPTDAPVQVLRRDRALRWLHWRNQHARLYLFLWLGTITAGLIYDPLFGLVLPLWVFMIFEERNDQYHDRVLPWCPYCRGDGGGGYYEASPTPTPDPAGVKAA